MSFYDVNLAWLKSSWLAERQHLWLEHPEAGAPAALPRWTGEGELPPAAPGARRGAVLAEERQGEIYRARVRVDEAAGKAFILFKMTFHPGWQASVDGKRRTTRMLSPGFVGLEMDPGNHEVEMRYVADRWIFPILGGSLVLVAAMFWAERRCHS